MQSVLSCLLLIATAASAENNSAQINIRADQMTFDITKGESIYTGNVSFTQGQMKLTGKKVAIKSRDNKIRQVTVDGNPARYHFTDQKNNEVHAQSENMQYNIDNKQLVMTGNARIKQTDNIVESRRIVYDTEKQLILAGSKTNNGDDEQRVNVILTPGKKQ